MNMKELEIVWAVIDELSQPVFAQATKNSRKGDEAMAMLSRITAAKAIVPDLKAFAIVGNRLDEQLYRRKFADELPEYAAEYLAFTDRNKVVAAMEKAGASSARHARQQAAAE